MNKRRDVSKTACMYMRIIMSCKCLLLDVWSHVHHCHLHSHVPSSWEHSLGEVGDNYALKCFMHLVKGPRNMGARCTHCIHCYRSHSLGLDPWWSYCVWVYSGCRGGTMHIYIAEVTYLSSGVWCPEAPD